MIVTAGSVQERRPVRGDAGYGSEAVILTSRRDGMQEAGYDFGRTRAFVLIGPVVR